MNYTVIYPDEAVTFALISCIVLIVLGVFGNALAIIAIACSRKLRRATTSAFIVSLCVTDFVFCAFNLPLTAIRYAHQAWVLGPLLCRLFPFFFYLNVAASLFSMMAVTINRYILIAHYHVYDRVYTGAKCALMIAACWGVPLALLLPTLANQWGCFGLREETFSCTILEHRGRSSKKVLFLIGFILPCLVIVLCYAGIFWVVRRSKRTMSTYMPAAAVTQMSASQMPMPTKRQTDEMNLTRMILVIFCAFLICFLPLMVVNVFDDDEKVPVMHVVASVLAWSAGVLNPFLYAITNRRYRAAFVALAPKKLRALHRAYFSPSSWGRSCSSSGSEWEKSNSPRATEVVFHAATDAPNAGAHIVQNGFTPKEITKL